MLAAKRGARLSIVERDRVALPRRSAPDVGEHHHGMLEPLRPVDRVQDHDVLALASEGGLGFGHLAVLEQGEVSQQVVEIGASRSLEAASHTHGLAEIRRPARAVGLKQGDLQQAEVVEDALDDAAEATGGRLAAKRLQRLGHPAMSHVGVYLRRRGEKPRPGVPGAPPSLLRPEAEEPEEIGVRRAEDRAGREASERVVVGGIVDDPERVNEIHDLFRLEVAAPLVRVERNAGRAQRLLVDRERGPGAEEDRDVAVAERSRLARIAVVASLDLRPRHAARDQVPDPRRDPPRLRLAAHIGAGAVAGVDDRHLDVRPALRLVERVKRPLGRQGHVFDARRASGEDGGVDLVQDVHELGACTERRAEQMAPGLPHALVLSLDHRDVRTPEAVDRLLRIADREERALVSPDAPEDRGLQGIRVLELVHEERLRRPGEGSSRPAQAARAGTRHCARDR